MVTAKKVEDLVKDDPVCIRGYGTASMVHAHGKVLRLTKLFVVVNVTSSNVNRQPYQARFRRDDGHRVPRTDLYGGTVVHTSCTKEKQGQ